MAGDPEVSRVAMAGITSTAERSQPEQLHWASRAATPHTPLRDVRAEYVHASEALCTETQEREGQGHEVGRPCTTIAMPRSTDWRSLPVCAAVRATECTRTRHPTAPAVQHRLRIAKMADHARM